MEKNKIPEAVSPFGEIKNNDSVNLKKWKSLFEALHPDINVFFSYENLGEIDLQEKVTSRHSFQFENSLHSLVIFVELPRFMKEDYYAGFPYDRMFSSVDAESDPLLYDECDIGCEPETHSWVDCYLSTVIAIDRYNNRLPQPEIFIPARRILVLASVVENKILLLRNNAVWRLPFAFFDTLSNSPDGESETLKQGANTLLPKVSCDNLSYLGFVFPNHGHWEIRHPYMIYAGDIFGDLNVFCEGIHESAYFSYEEVCDFGGIQTIRGTKEVVNFLIKKQKMRYNSELD